MENQTSDITNISLTNQQLDFVLASLRMAQAVQDGRPVPNTIDHFKHFGEPLKSEEIDLLCEKINCGETIVADSPGEFDVNVFAEIRVKVPGIKAASMEEASEMAKEAAIGNYLSGLSRTPSPYTVEFTDTIDRTVVDVVGDDDYSQSREFTD